MTEDVKIKISSEFNEQGINALRTSLKGVDTQVKTTKQSIDQMGIGLQALASGALTAFVVKAVNMGAELNVLRSNFIGSAKDIELFRKATAGTVDDAGLIKLSNYASDLGVNLEDQAKLFSLAEDAADKYGGTVESNFERVINASDGSAKGLRSVGISTKDFGQEVERLTASMGLKLDAMTADEQQNIRLQAIYNLTGTTLESVNNKTQDSKDKMDSLQVTVTNLTAKFGQGLVSGLNSMSEGMDRVTKSTGLASINFESFVFILGKASFFATIPNMINNIGNAIDYLTEKIKQYNQTASLSTPTYQFQYSNEDAIQYDKYGNIIPPKTETANQTYNKSVNKNSKGGGTDKVAKEIVKAAYDNLNDQISYLFKGGTRSAYDIFSKKVAITGVAQNVNENVLSSISPIKEDSRNTLEDIQTGYSLIAQSMNLLNVGTDTFVGKLMSAFNFVNSALNIGSSIVSFITKIIPGLGGMPSMSGGSMTVDTSRLINQNISMSSSPVNIYMSSNVSQKYFKAQIEDYNSMKQYTKA